MLIVLFAACRDTAGLEQRVTKLEAAKAPSEKHWYCHAMQPSRTFAGAGIDDLKVFTTCTGFADGCDSMPCVIAPAAWCGSDHICTFTRALCQDEAPNKGSCVLVPADKWTPAVEGRSE